MCFFCCCCYWCYLSDPLWKSLERLPRHGNVFCTSGPRWKNPLPDPLNVKVFEMLACTSYWTDNRVVRDLRRHYAHAKSLWFWKKKEKLCFGTLIAWIRQLRAKPSFVHNSLKLMHIPTTNRRLIFYFWYYCICYWEVHVLIWETVDEHWISKTRFSFGKGTHWQISSLLVFYALVIGLLPTQRTSNTEVWRFVEK